MDEKQKRHENIWSDKVRNPQDKEQSEDARQRKRLLKVCESKEGREFLRSLMKTCGYQTTSVAADEHGKILIKTTIYAEARRELWLRIRKLIPRNHLIEIEIPMEADHERQSSTGYPDAGPDDDDPGDDAE